MKYAPRLLLALALAAGIALALVYRDHLDTAALRAWIAAAGLAGPLVFMAIYAVATVFFLPGSLLTLAGGALFGPIWGTLYNLAGATLGAGLAFLVARHLAADWVQARSGGLLQRLVTGVEAEGWRFVAFTRLVPVFPFNLLNYALHRPCLPHRPPLRQGRGAAGATGLYPGPGRTGRHDRLARPGLVRRTQPHPIGVTQ